MPLKHLLLISAYVLASTNAAVNFYGSERPNGDYVTCEVPDAPDEEVSAALGMLYFPSEVVPESNDLQFNETLVCGDLASIVVEFACYDLGGESTCIPTHAAADPDSDSADEETDTADAESDTADEETDAVSRRSLTRFEKRAAAECDPYTLKCKNQYQSTTGWCASDYTAETYNVKGYQPDVWCSKPCTDEEIEVCDSQKCGKGKEQCEKFGDSNDCVQGLTKCAGSPVKMPENLCTTKYMPKGFGIFCKNKDPACLAYEDGACTLSAEQYAAYLVFLSQWLNVGKA
jgi:hypothetical protein